MHVHVHVHVPAVYTRPYQAALNRGAFGVLRRRFGCELECFASALNCRYERYCSAFPDVDAPFGAAGDFFASDFDEGSFEANPPFVPALIGAMDLGCMPRLLPVDIGIPLDASACTTDGRGSHGCGQPHECRVLPCHGAHAAEPLPLPSPGAMAAKMDTQLRRADIAHRALAFVVIVPNWRPEKVWP